MLCPKKKKEKNEKFTLTKVLKIDEVTISCIIRIEIEGDAFKIF